MKKWIIAGLTTARMLRFIYASTILVLVGRTPNASGQTVTVLHSFAGPVASPNDGYTPEAGLMQGSDGNFYGTTVNGGTSTNCYEGCGTVFRISPSGSYTNLHSFVGYPNDGSSPYGGLVQGRDGNFYGTTANGGINFCPPLGCGTVFRISPSGSYTNLHSFVGYPSDGSSPYGGLVQGNDGNLYGTTFGGGMNDFGTVFRIFSSGSYTTLYSFIESPNFGWYPYGGLVQGSDGNFYGTTEYGGKTNLNNGNGYGTVFRISPSGNYTNLHSFVGPPNDGRNPSAGLVQGGDSNFYGTTSSGGEGVFYGMVFRISSTGSETNLYSFDSTPNDGITPYGTLVLGSDGNFYGTTSDGGTNPSNYGIVFRISPSGSYTNLYRFVGYPNDGQNPLAGLVQGSDGSFYGTTLNGGTSTNCYQGCGTVFKLAIPLNPPANQISEITLAGTNLTVSVPSVAGETYQLQFSSSMNPTNWVNVPVSVTNSIGALLTLTNFGGALQSQGFYRFDITP